MPLSVKDCLWAKWNVKFFLISMVDFGREYFQLFQSSSKPHRNCLIRWSKCSHFRVDDLFWDWNQEVFGCGKFWISHNLFQLLGLQLPHLDQERHACSWYCDWLREFCTWIKAGMASWLWLPRLWRILPSPVVLTLARQERVEQLLRGLNEQHCQRLARPRILSLQLKMSLWQEGLIKLQAQSIERL